MNRKGISFTEILLAFFIMAMTLLPISGIMSYGHRGTQKDFRQVQAIEILVARLNQVSSIPFRKLLSLIPSGNSVTISSPIFTGTNLEMAFGDLAIGPSTFTASVSLNGVPASFSYRPVDFGDLAYDVASAATWKFGTPVEDLYNGTDSPYKILQTHVTVSWIEPVVLARRKVDAVSYVVDLED